MSKEKRYNIIHNIVYKFVQYNVVLALFIFLIFKLIIFIFNIDNEAARTFYIYYYNITRIIIIIYFILKVCKDIIYDHSIKDIKITKYFTVIFSFVSIFINILFMVIKNDLDGLVMIFLLNEYLLYNCYNGIFGHYSQNYINDHVLWTVFQKNPKEESADNRIDAMFNWNFIVFPIIDISIILASGVANGWYFIFTPIVYVLTYGFYSILSSINIRSRALEVIAISIIIIIIFILPLFLYVYIFTMPIFYILFSLIYSR